MVLTRSQNEANPKVKRDRKVSKAINPLKRAKKHKAKPKVIKMIEKIER